MSQPGTGTARTLVSPRPLFNQAACLRGGVGRSTCSRCRDICPVSGFRLCPDGISLPADCHGCQFCTAVCPAGALRGMLPPMSAAVRDRLQIRCHQRPARTGISIPCVGAIPQALVAAWAKRGTTVVLETADCAACALQPGADRFRERMQATAGEWQPEWRSSAAEAAPARRALFQTVGAAVTGGFRTALELEEAVGIRNWYPALGAGCTGCPVCEAVCPRDVLVREETPEGITYYVDTTAGCNGCGKCVDSCQLGAVTLARLDEDRSGTVLARRIPRRKCVDCGMDITISDQDRCPACSRKGRQFRLRMGGSSGIPLRME